MPDAMRIYYLIIAIALFVLLRFTSRWLNSISASRSLHRLLLRGFPFLEFVIWLAFGLWMLNRLFTDWPYYSVMVAAIAVSLVIITSWYFLRDFISGIILKTETPFEKNQLVRTTTHQGVLTKVGYRSLELCNDKGEVVKIPYSQLTSSAINLSEKGTNLQGHETVLRIKSKVPLHEIAGEINSSLLLLPWIAVNQDPKINIIEQSDDNYIISVFYQTIHPESALQVNYFLKSRFVGERE